MVTRNQSPARAVQTWMWPHANRHRRRLDVRCVADVPGNRPVMAAQPDFGCPGIASPADHSRLVDIARCTWHRASSDLHPITDRCDSCAFVRHTHAGIFGLVMRKKSDLSGDATVARDQTLLTSGAGGELMAMSTDRGSRNRLDPIGARIPALIGQLISGNAICAKLLAKYDINAGLCGRGVVALVEQLRAEGLPPAGRV